MLNQDHLNAVITKADEINKLAFRHNLSNVELFWPKKWEAEGQDIKNQLFFVVKKANQNASLDDVIKFTRDLAKEIGCDLDNIQVETENSFKIEVRQEILTERTAISLNNAQLINSFYTKHYKNEASLEEETKKTTTPMDLDTKQQKEPLLSSKTPIDSTPTSATYPFYQQNATERLTDLPEREIKKRKVIDLLKAENITPDEALSFITEYYKDTTPVYMPIES